MSEESEEFDIQLKEEYLEHKEKYALSGDGEK